MKERFRRCVESAIGRLPLNLLLQASGVKPLNIFYHKSHDTDPVYFRKDYVTKSPKQFEAEIDYLLKRFVPITLEQLLSAESSDVIPKRSFFLSFDDGYRELAEVIAPILRRKGVPATFFICSSLVDNKNWLFEDQIGMIQSKTRNFTAEEIACCEDACLKPYGLSFSALQATRVPPPGVALIRLGEHLDIDWEGQLAEHRPYLTSSQINELLSQGFAIGAHGIDHTVFESMSVDEQFRQIDESCQALQSQFKLSYRAFAFPYGEFGVSRDFLLRLRQDNIVDGLFGTRGLVIDEFEPWLRQRLWCEGHEGDLQSHLRCHLGAAVLRNFRGRNKVNRRS